MGRIRSIDIEGEADERKERQICTAIYGNILMDILNGNLLIGRATFNGRVSPMGLAAVFGFCEFKVFNRSLKCCETVFDLGDENFGQFFAM